jgi:hypothetical protein
MCELVMLGASCAHLTTLRSNLEVLVLNSVYQSQWAHVLNVIADVMLSESVDIRAGLA